MTDPGTADRTYIGPMTPELVEQILDKERPDAVLPTMGGQTALNLAKALEEGGILAKYGVELIGAKLPSIDKVGEERGGGGEGDGLPRRARRRRPSPAPHTPGRGPGALQGGHGRHRPQHAQVGHRDHDGGSARGARGHRRLPQHHPPRVHARRHGRRHCVQHGRVPGDRDGRHHGVADQPGPHRALAPRLERVRARGHARPGRQRRHHLLDRKRRPDGRAHGRLDHGRARADADRQRVPAPARRVGRHHPGDGGRVRRLQRPGGGRGGRGARGARARGRRFPPARPPRLPPPPPRWRSTRPMARCRSSR